MHLCFLARRLEYRGVLMRKSAPIEVSRLTSLPIVPACETKLFSIWENALDSRVS